MTTTGIPNNASPPPRIQQPSIRSFFKPKQPVYAAPPVLPTTNAHSNGNGNGNENAIVGSAPLDSNGPPKASTTQIPMSAPPAQKPATIGFPAQSPIKSQGSAPKLPPDYSIEIPQSQHIQPLRRINSLLLPIPYPDSFYSKILSPPSFSDPISISFSRVVTHTSPISPSEPKVIGSLICRLDPSPPCNDATPPANTYSIYLQSLAILSPYRNLGLATTLLDSVVSVATGPQIPIGVKIEGLYAHVWTENTEALEWYKKRGFEKGELIEGYYRRLKPQSAFLLRRRFSVNDHLAISSRGVIPDDAKSAPPPSLGNGTVTRPAPSHAASFQERRPDREWNDLPEDVLPGTGRASENQSKDSSRNSSKSRLSEGGMAKAGKKKRSYPAAAFGGGV